MTQAQSEFLPCPCCGALTVSTFGTFDICDVCKWEDDPHSQQTQTTLEGRIALASPKHGNSGLKSSLVEISFCYSFYRHEEARFGGFF